MISDQRGKNGADRLVGPLVDAAGLRGRLAVGECARERWRDAGRLEEVALVEGAHPDVRAAFAAGRVCAHEALAKLGAPEGALLRQGGDGLASRAPAWPDGFTGSISHATSYCAAIAAARRDFESVGLDVEAPSRVSARVLDRVCTPSERSGLDERNEAWPGALHFAAKEAFYKVWSPLTRRSIGFRDVEVRAADAGRFEIELVGDVDPGVLGPGPWPGLFGVRDDLVAAIVLLPAR